MAFDNQYGSLYRGLWCDCPAPPLQLQLLHAVQRSVCLQLVSGASEARVQTLMGSERVRKQLPEALKKLQQSLWAEADEDVTVGNGEYQQPGHGTCP